MTQPIQPTQIDLPGINPTTPSVADRVHRLVVESLSLDPEEVTADAKFVDLGADSLDTVEMAMALEEEFKIEIPDDDINDHMQTVGGVVAYIERARAAKYR
jgi:acyl carrier protein